MPETFTFEEAAEPKGKSFTFEEANTFSFEDASADDTPLRKELAAAGVNLGTRGDTSRPPQFTPEDRLQASMLAQAGANLPPGQPDERPMEKAERFLGYGEQVLTDLANPARYLARLVDAPIDATLNRNQPELQGATERAVQVPGINLPRAGEAESGPGKVVAGTYNAAADLLAAFTTPEAMALLPAGTSKPVLTAWISQMAGHQPQRVMRAADLFQQGKTQEAYQELATGAGELGLAELGRRHVMGERLPKPETEPARGELPDPNNVAVNRAAPGTLRPEEQRAFGPPEAERPEGMVTFERVPIVNRAGEVLDIQIIERSPPSPGGEGRGEGGSIIPVQRGTIRSSPEGGKLPERRQGFQRTAEDILAERADPEPTEGRAPRVPDQLSESRPAPARGEPEASAAGSATPAPEPTIRESRIVEAPPELAIPAEPAKPASAAAVAETITGRDERPGSAMPAEREERPIPQRRPSKPTDRPWDLIDEIEGKIGKLDPKLIREADPDWKPTGAARRLFRSGGERADSAITGLTTEGNKLGVKADMKPEELGHLLNQVAANRKTTRTQNTKANATAELEGKQLEQFEKRVLYGERPRNQKAEPIGVDHLVEGDEFQVQNHKFKVDKLEFDEDGNLQSLTVKDGPKFGVQRIDPGRAEVIHIDPGSLKEVPRNTEFAPAEPAAPAPTIKRGQNQGDLLGSGDIDFNLYGERTGDGARAAAELAQREANAQAAAEFAAKNQQELPGSKPGLVSNTAAEAWADRTIAKGRTHTQMSLTGIDPELAAAYLTKSIAIMERGARKFAEWSRRMIAEHGDAVRPHLRALFEQSQATMRQLEADGRKMRSVSRRGTASEQLPAEAREQLTTDPASFYRVQNPRTVEDAVALMSNNELRQPLDVSQQGNAQNYVARQLELSRRLMADPATRAEGYALFQQLSQSGTSFGQLVNQFKLLRNSTPDGLLEVVNRRLGEQNAAPLTPTQRVQLRVLGGRSLADVSAWRQAEEAWATNPSRANFKAVIEAREAAEHSGRMFNERVQRIVPRGFWDTLTAMNMGGKLAMISQERNVVANVMLMPWRAAARIPAAGLDMIDSMVRNKPREIALVPGSTMSGAALSALRSVPDAARVLLRGDTASGLGKGESHINLRPLVALREILAGELMNPNKRLAQKLTLLAEASPPGYFAAGMLRGLNALDLPSRNAARGRLIAEELKLMQKRSGGQFRVNQQMIRDATQAPELFLSPEAVARINREALGAVFQDPNVFTRWVLGLEQVAPAPVRFMMRNVVPFVSLPVNWAGKLLGWSPAGFATHAARHALKGDGRAAKLAAGEAIVGSLAWTAAAYLYSKGLVSPPLDSEDEQQKMRLLAGDIMPPNHVNVSGLERLFKGEDPAWRAGDKTKDFTYYGSVVGAQMQMYAAGKRAAEKQAIPESKVEDYSNFIWNATGGAGGYLVNQTFMQGVRDLLDAMKSDRKMETFLSGYAGSLLDTGVPRQMEAINKSIRTYQREIKDDALDKRLHNVLVNRFGAFTKADEALPFKRDSWGRPIRETPAGSNPWLYQLFDVGKSRQIPDDPIKLEIYNLARRTGDLRAIPSPPDKSISIAGKTYALDQQQLSRLQELVGQNREQLAQRVVTPRFLARPDAQKLAILDRAWSMASQRGTAQFYREAKDALEEKRGPAGFRR